MKPKYSRAQIWAHNSFLGHAKMIERNMGGIQSAHSTTDLARGIALRIQVLAVELSDALKTRRDE